MTGEYDLRILLGNLQPELDSSRYIFCSLNRDALPNLPFSPLLVFQEREGVTVIATLEQAVENELAFEATWARIELRVHSSLTAVGLLAEISRRMAQGGISLNVVSAFYHDHLFVPWESRELALQLLRELSRRDEPGLGG